MTSRRLLPTFFIIGAQKAATTTLYSILRQHPDVFLPELKETHFLLGGDWARRGLGWYESLYASAGDAIQMGEASPSYSMFPMFDGVPERAVTLAPDARIIYTIRHPVERMVSHWVQATSAGYEHRPLEEATVWGSVYFMTSCYGLQLVRWATAFPREAILVVRSEDLSSDPGSVVDRILAHLGLPAGWRPPEPGARLNPLDGKLRTLRGLRRLSGAVRGAGFEQTAVRIARQTPLKQRAGLVHPYIPSELDLPSERATSLLECFRSDFALLRKFVGDEMDLYGLA